MANAPSIRELVFNLMELPYVLRMRVLRDFDLVDIRAELSDAEVVKRAIELAKERNCLGQLDSALRVLKEAEVPRIPSRTDMERLQAASSFDPAPGESAIDCALRTIARLRELNVERAQTIRELLAKPDDAAPPISFEDDKVPYTIEVDLSAGLVMVGFTFSEPGTTVRASVGMTPDECDKFDVELAAAARKLRRGDGPYAQLATEANTAFIETECVAPCQLPYRIDELHPHYSMVKEALDRGDRAVLFCYHHAADFRPAHET